MAGQSDASDKAALEVGQTVFEYRIARVLGGGGFGITYLAQDINLQLPVALKEYFPSGLAVRSTSGAVQPRSVDAIVPFDTGLERFIDEARALAAFRHPNIVRVLRYFKENGSAYIVMEYESGDPLRHWLSKQMGLDQLGLLRLVYPLLDGLEAVHRLNFLHRDVKPDNIYIRADGTPVLLDFGAARRVSADQDVTNIVSPGYAPFEQYHSRGNQGPWTDLYSLGAVLYWLTTGVKPLDSASRTHDDAMPKALDIGNRAVYSELLLQTIDWALTPDEKKRPQTVAALRAAFKQAESARVEVVATVRREGNPSITLQPGSAPRPTGLQDVLRKNVMSTIMFLDLVAYSTHSVDQQVALKTLFNELILKAIGGIDEASRILLDTGDGAAICFLGDPEEALRSALLLRDLLLQRYGQKLSLRVGLHLGPVRMLMDVNNRVNVVGDGINVACRVMDFSTANQVVVSRAYYEVITRINDGASAMFEFLGARLDKHQRSHELFALVDPRAVQLTANAGGPSFEPTLRLSPEELIKPEEVRRIEQDLIQAIGPLAHVLVKKAILRARNVQDLRGLLSVSIQDVLTREAFVQGRSNNSRLVNTSHALSALSVPNSPTTPMAVSATRKDASSGRGFAPGAVTRPPSQMPDTVPWGGTQRVDSGRLNSAAPAKPMSNFCSAEQQSQLERALSQHIGPLGKTLVRKEMGRHTTLNSLVKALSWHIDGAEDRARFLTAAGKAGPFSH